MSIRYISKQFQKMAEKKGGIKTISDNRQARHLYNILDTYEAGIELLGTEVKSIREGKVNIKDGYVLVRNGQAWLTNVHISPYTRVSEFFNHEPRRSRRLLMHKQEIHKLIGQVEQKGLTLIPLKMYFKNGWIKVRVGLAKGKKNHDKREDSRRKDDKRDMARAMKRG